MGSTLKRKNLLLKGSNSSLEDEPPYSENKFNFDDSLSVQVLEWFAREVP